MPRSRAVLRRKRLPPTLLPTIRCTRERPRCRSRGASPRCSPRIRAPISPSMSTGLSSRRFHGEFGPARTRCGVRRATRARRGRRLLPAPPAPSPSIRQPTRVRRSAVSGTSRWRSTGPTRCARDREQRCERNVRVDPADLREAARDGMVSFGFPALVERVARTSAQPFSSTASSFRITR